MRFSKAKAIALSAVVAMLCAALIVAASLAIFSDSAGSNVHLQAGTLDAGLWKTEVSGYIVGQDGNLAPYEESGLPVDLEKDGADIFQLSDVIPGVWQEAVLEVRNAGTVAFEYSVSIANIKADGQTAQNLLGRLLVTVTPSGGAAVSFLLKDAAQQGRNIPLGTLAAKANGTFSVRAEFTDDGTHEPPESLAGAEVSFDLTVSAVQVTPE